MLPSDLSLPDFEIKVLDGRWIVVLQTTNGSVQQFSCATVDQAKRLVSVLTGCGDQ